MYPEPSCTPMSVATYRGAHRNAADIVLPYPVDPVSDSTPLRITLQSVPLPKGGTFPMRVAAELTNIDDKKPHFMYSQGKQIFIPPALSFGAIVNVFAGDGNDRPFREDKLNTLYVRIILGSLLRAQAPEFDTNSTQGLNRTAGFTIILPQLYTCAELHPSESTLNVFGMDRPQGKGSLPSSTGASAHLGYWTVSTNRCIFRLNPFATIFADGALFIKGVLNNPVLTLPQRDPTNVWYIAMESWGEIVNASVLEPVSTPYLRFVGGSPPGSTGFYSANVAVQGKLVASIAPLIMTPGARGNELYVFFLTEQGAGPRSRVRIEGPAESPFDFFKYCEPRSLDDLYYVDPSPSGPTYPLPGIERQISCQGVQSTIRPSKYFGAFLLLSGRLRPGRQYAFGIAVGNPDVYLPSHRLSWHITTYTSLIQRIDATYSTAPRHPRETEQRSFGLYEFQPAQIDVLSTVYVALSTRLPTSVTMDTAFAAIGGIFFPRDTSCQLNIEAPALFEWSYLFRDFIIRPAEVNLLLPNQGILPDGSLMVDATLPTGFIASPLVEPRNVMMSDRASNFEQGKRYGLAAKLRIPDRPNTASINSFTIQCGPRQDQILDRPLAVHLDAPPVAALVDATVRYATNIIGAANRLKFTVRTTQAIPSTGALMIRGPPGFYALPNCWARSPTLSVNERLQRARASLLEYENLLVVQQAQEQILGVGSPEYIALSSEVAGRLEDLQNEVGALWQERVTRRALPLDTGCWYQAETPIRRLVEITMQVGLPNLDVDLRLGAFTRLYAPQVLPQGQRVQAWLAAGLYEFELEASNPTVYLSNDEATLVPQPPTEGVVLTAPVGCGTERCWHFIAYEAPFSAEEVSDRPAISKGFAIVAEMTEAFLVDLTEAQRETIERNDRPLVENQLVFAITLNQTIPEGRLLPEPPPGSVAPPLKQRLVVNAPEGYLFPEDCTVLTNKTQVFGSEALWPEDAGLAEWTAATGTVTMCDGMRNKAIIDLSGSAGLLPQQRYAFRIDVLSNPIATPPTNFWSIEFYGTLIEVDDPAGDYRVQHAEASRPFVGFEQWTFYGLRVVPRTTERSTGNAGDPGGGITINPVTVLFSPYNEVRVPGGALLLQAPVQFTWHATAEAKAVAAAAAANIATAAEAEGPSCEAVLLEEPPELPEAAQTVMAAGSLGISFWNEIPNRCNLHPIFQNVIVVRLTGEQGLRSRGIFALKVSIENPAVEVLTKGAWELRSLKPSVLLANSNQTQSVDDLEIVDVAEVEGFYVTKGMSSLTISARDNQGFSWGGLGAAMEVVMAFVEPVFPGDIIRLMLPPGYLLRRPVSEAESIWVRNRCLRVLARSRPGAAREQVFKCFSNLMCVLPLLGHGLSAASAVQLHSPDRACGGLPGLGIDIRRTLASPSETGALTDFGLGFNVSVGEYRVCYCHGDGGCNTNQKFCQEAGTLTVTDLCADASCPGAASSCQTSCNPRTGLCLDAPEFLHDGAPCEDVDVPGQPFSGGCKAGACDAASMPPGPVADDGSDFNVVPISCKFDTFHCTDRTLTMTVGHDGYERAATLFLELNATHPESTPPEDNVLVVEHERAVVVRGSRVVLTYSIQPRFRLASTRLAGTLRAGGALTSIELRVRAVQSATSLWLRMKEPIGFDFSRAYLLENGTIMTQVGDTIEIAAPVTPSRTLVLMIHDARLPLEGGPGRFDLLSFNGTTLRDVAYDMATFRTPVNVDVSEVALLNQYKQDTTGQFGVEAAFGNRLGEWALLRMKLRFSSEASERERRASRKHTSRSRHSILTSVTEACAYARVHVCAHSRK